MVFATFSTKNCTPEVKNIYFCKLTEDTTKGIKETLGVHLTHIVGICEQYEDRLIMTSRVRSDMVSFEINELETFMQVEPEMFLLGNDGVKAIIESRFKSAFK